MSGRTTSVARVSSGGRVGGWADGPGDAPLDGPGWSGALGRWLAEARVDDAARARARQRWLERQAAEETSFGSVLVDLAERGRPVLVQTAAARRHRGRLVGVGVDFVAMHTDSDADVLVATGAIHSMRTEPGQPAALSGRAVILERHLADAVAALAAERPRVVVATGADAAVIGDLVSTGRDVVTLRVDGDTRANVYIPLDAVVEIALATRGDVTPWR